MFTTIAVIGAGTMGNGIAHVFAQYGFSVNLVDISQPQLNAALELIGTNLDRQIAKGTITEETKADSLKNITTLTSISAGVKDADLVIEAATENEELKLSIFKQIDEGASGDCIMASNTSSISITRIAAATSNPSHVIGMHFMNPVPVMKLVEIIKGYGTSKDVSEKIIELSKKIGKIPCEVNDYPGFIANRILMPMINEAVFSLHEGVAGVEEIDTIMKLGMAHPMGPFQLADFIGLDVCHSIMKVMYDGFGNPKYAACPLLTKMVTSGDLGIKSGKGFYDYQHGSKNLRVNARFSR